MKNNHCSPIILAHETGSGKSSTCQTTGITKGRIILIVQNTLSLSSDKMSKINFVLSKHNGTHSTHLDSIKTPAHNQFAHATLSNLPQHTNENACTFASPEVLLKSKCCQLMQNIMCKRKFSFACVYEV